MADASFIGQGFRQEYKHGHQVNYSDEGCEEGRQGVAPVYRTEVHRRAKSAQDSAECRPDDETQTECRADQPQAARSILLVGDVGDISLGDRYVSTRKAIQNPAQEKQPELVGDAKYDKTDCCTQDTDQQHRATPQPI